MQVSRFSNEEGEWNESPPKLYCLEDENNVQERLALVSFRDRAGR
jgi:hypothetical protein